MGRKWKILLVIVGIYVIASFIVSDGRRYCSDGTTTTSRGRGTCSWHGGVGMQPEKRILWWVFLASVGVWAYRCFRTHPQPKPTRTTTPLPPKPLPTPSPNHSTMRKERRPPQNGLPPCPSCGAEMKERVAKRGRNRGNRFLGCTSFPECRGTLPYSLPTTQSIRDEHAHISVGWGGEPEFFSTTNHESVEVLTSSQDEWSPKP